MSILKNLMLSAFLAYAWGLSADPLPFLLDRDRKLSDWKQDTSPQFQPFGEVIPIQKSDGSVLVRLKSAGPPVVLLHKKSYRLKPGEVLRFRFSISGKGSMKAGGYFYDKDWKWLGASTKNFDADASEKQHAVMIDFIDARLKQDPAYMILILSAAGWMSDITVGGLSAEIVSSAEGGRQSPAEARTKSSDSDILREKLFHVNPENFCGNIPVIHSNPPVIDGRIGEKEWGKSLELTGFSRPQNGLLPNESGRIYVQKDGKYLYIAVRTSAPNNDPGAGLVSRARGRDSAVYDDDSVEFILQSDREPDVCYHIILNNNEAVYDRRVTYQDNVSDPGWNIRNMKVGSRAESCLWDLEVGIPLNEIGNPEKFLKLNVARNWFNYGATAINPAALHIDRSRMGTFTFSESLPVMKIQELGAPSSGKWDIRLRADNPSREKYLLGAALYYYALRKQDGRTTRELRVERIAGKEIPPGASGDLSIVHDADSTEARYFSTVIYNPGSGEVVFSRFLTARKELFALEQPGAEIFELRGFGSAMCWYYPSLNKARLLFFLNPLFQRVQITADFGAEKIRAIRGGDGTSAVVPVPVREGNHPLTLSIMEENGKTTTLKPVFQLTKRTFPWENNTLGKDKVILPPFTPIRVDGNKVAVIQREICLNREGVWSSLKSQGRELLAAPMHWELSVNGEMQKLSGNPFPLTCKDNGYSTEGVASAKSGSGVVINSEVQFEYDGFFWSRVSLDNVAGKTVDRLTLVIPLLDSEMPLFHVISNTIRNNPGGRIPGGDGEVWNGSQLKRLAKSIHPQLVPHIWLGGVERGLAWFTDSSFGYRLRKDRNALRLIREKEVLRMEIDIINRPVRLRNGHAFTYGMQATPVKPLEKESRRLVYDAFGNGIEGMWNVQCLADSILGFPLQWAKVPEGEDYSLLSAMADAARSGKKIDAMSEQRKFRAKHDAVTLRKINDTPKVSPLDGVKHFLSVRDNFVKLCMENPNRTPSLPYKYSDPRLIYFQDDVPQYFKSEWWIGNPQYFGAWRSYPVPSNLDYMVYGYYNEIKYGMHGIYLDDVFLIPNMNTDTAARVDDEGEKHSEIGILALRELVKRIAVIQHQFGRYPRVLQVHMTNAQLIPCFAFATSQLAWESMFGETPLPERYTLDNVQAEGLGRRLGLESVALGGIVRKTTAPADWPAKKKQLSRSFLALALPHDVKVWNRVAPNDIDWKTVQSVYEKMSAFGHWKEDCSFVPYWENDPAIGNSNPSVVVSSYRRPGKILLILGNRKDRTEVSLRLHYAKLGLPENTPVIDLETNTPVDLKHLKLEQHDFRLLQAGK
ncbi:MAG: hypothetical protein BWY31_00926 [Lentisphaerae bacterium ADurb.Bin242]|nr:MAG: hypothetical protein BWY31_00926 [Lentisphaerae bacterium ADurb.Bin242]